VDDWRAVGSRWRLWWMRVGTVGRTELGRREGGEEVFF
jgi:hypothetical protein